MAEAALPGTVPAVSVVITSCNQADCLEAAVVSALEQGGDEVEVVMTDDAKAEPDWVATACQVGRDPAPEIFGGPIYPFYLTERPRWFKDDYEIRLTTDQARALGEGEYISGSNLVLRRDLLERLGGFDPNLGMKGRALAYGEEVAFIIHARRSGAAKVVYYHPGLRVRHLVPARKMHVGFFLRSRLAVGGDTRGILGHAGGRGKAARGLVRSAATIVFRVCVGLPLRNRRSQPYWQNYVVERVAPLFGQVASYYGMLRQ